MKLTTLSPEEVWHKLGAEGRVLLREWAVLVCSQVARRVPEDSVLRSIDTITATAAPIELVAHEARGCPCPPCTKGPIALGAVNSLIAHLSAGHHAFHLLQIFLENPHLAVPSDIPSYALWCYEKALTHQGKEDKLKAKEERAERRVAKKIFDAQARAAYKRSYPYRIAKAEEKAARIALKIEEAQWTIKRTIKRLRKKLVAAQRSVAGLRRGAEKKGSST